MTPSDARRILVAGTSGSGKTTLAAKIATATGITHTEIDGLYHHAGWTPNQRFQEEVQALIAGEAWITELQYRTVRQMLAERAQLLIWLDLPRHVVLRRIVMRTVQRSVLRVELWNAAADDLHGPGSHRPLVDAHALGPGPGGAGRARHEPATPSRAGAIERRHPLPACAARCRMHTFVRTSRWLSLSKSPPRGGFDKLNQRVSGRVAGA